MNFINEIIEWFTNESTTTGEKIIILIGTIALFVSLAIAIWTAISRKFKGAMIWLGIFIFIAILTTVGFNVMKAIGEGTGQDIENQVGFITFTFQYIYSLIQ